MSEQVATPQVAKDAKDTVAQSPAGTDAPAASTSSASATENGSETLLGEESSESPSLYVGELLPSVSEAILFEIFSSVGSVASIRVCRDSVTHESLGYAYVNFQNAADARKAMDELNYSLINGRACRIMSSQRDPSVRKSSKSNVFIKNLDSSIDNKSLHDTFSAFGKILSAKVVTDQEGKSLNFGFIHFSSPEAAQAAIQTVNGMVLNDRAVYVAQHVPRVERESRAEAQRAQFTNVYVKNLAETIDQAKLESIFGEFGEITSAVLSVSEDKKSRGFGFVNFSSHEAAQRAVDELNDKEIEGKAIYVGRAQNKFERQNELKQKYDAHRMEQLTKYQGVNLYIKNIEDSIDSEKLKEAFALFGTITSARLMVDEQGKSRGFGFVCYSKPEEANRAIAEMNQHMLGSKPLYVTLAQRKEVRSNQMRQQVNARNQLRMQQAAVSGGLGPQFVGAPMMYPGQPGFINGAPAPGVRIPFPGSHMMVPRGTIPMNQWQQQQGPIKGQQPTQTQTVPPQRESLESQVENLPEDQKKQVIGEALYPRIVAQEGINDDLAAKITGMLLDMPNKDLFALDKDDALLQEQVQDALEAYNSYLKSQEA